MACERGGSVVVVQRCLQPEPITEKAWAPYGWLPVDDTDPRDGQHRLEFALGDAHINVIRHERDALRSDAGGIWCDELFRHHTHTQALMVLDHRAVIVVASPEAPPEHVPGDTTVHAFALDPHDAVVLHRSTWHWGPYPLEARAVRLLNVQGLHYQEDNARVDLRVRGESLLITVA